MRRRSGKLVIVFVAAALLGTGCGGEYPGDRDERAVSSGSAVSENAVSEKEKWQAKGRYCSDTNLYMEFWGMAEAGDEEEDVSDGYMRQGVVQMRLDGSCKKEIDLGRGVSSLIGVVDHWLYYAITDLDVNENWAIRVFRVPIGKDADGYDEIKTEETEEIISAEAGICSEYGIYADEKYLFYPDKYEPDEEQFRIVKYDIQHRKEVAAQTIPDGDEIEKIWRMGDRYMMHVRTIDTDVFTMPVDGKEWSQVTDSGYMLEDNISYCDQFLFYEGFPIEGDECGLGDDAWYKYGPNIRMYDGEQEQSFVTWKQLREAVEEAEELKPGGELKECVVTDLFCEGKRCYIQVQAQWDHKGHNYMKYLIFSKEPGEDSLRYEKQWIESMRKKEGEYKGKWYVKEKKRKKVLEDNSVIAPVHCMGMADGKAYFSFYDDDTNRRHAAYYELSTGDVHEITEKDAAYYQFFYNELYCIESGTISEGMAIGSMGEDEKGISEFCDMEDDIYFEPDGQ